MKTLLYTHSSLELVQECTYSMARLKAHPLTTSLVTDFDKLNTELVKLLTHELELAKNIIVAQATVDAIDDQLDLLLLVLTNDILSAVHNDRKAPLYQHFFGTQNPANMRKPVLGEQLETMRTWVSALTTSTVPTLKAHGTSLATLVTNADAAVEALRKAIQQEDDFMQIGERKKFIDTFNALRKNTYGKLAEIRHTYADQNLPHDFAEHFFLQQTKESKVSLSIVERTIERLEAQLTKHKSTHEQLLAKKKEKEQNRHTKIAMQSEIQALEQEAAQRQSKLAELKAQLNKLT